MSLANNKVSLKSILESNEPTVGIYITLENGTQVHLDKRVPYLLICRDSNVNSAISKIVKSGASFLVINNEKASDYQQFLIDLTSEMSTKFGSFLLVELYESKRSNSEFTISGPSDKLPTSLEILKDELLKIDSRRNAVQLNVNIENSKERHQLNENNIVEIDSIRDSGGTLLSVEIPPVYKDDEGFTYPIYFKQFRKSVFFALQQGIFEFVRVQTNSKLISYKALGKRNIHEELLKIDHEISQIQASYQFLLLVAPVNIQNIKNTFFESHYKEVVDYHYRLLPVDPDLLRRKLYDLRIDEIDDPAMAFLYEEKREEIEHEISMLKERGTKNFFYSSVRLYGAVESDLLNVAKDILNEVDENRTEQENCTINAHDFREIAEREFAFFREQAPSFGCKVHIRKDVNIIMVSRGELYLPADYTMTELDANALIQHEIGTHVLTYFNGKQQPLSQLAVGLANYDPLQEGIAVLSEYLTGALSGNRLRILAGRVVAGAALFEGMDFKSMFHLLKEDYDFTDERAFNITSRMFQGGGFLKDIIYLKGLFQLKSHLENKGDLRELLSGKFALDHLHIIQELTQRELLKPPMVLPRYLEDDKAKVRLNQFINEPKLSKMIIK